MKDKKSLYLAAALLATSCGTASAVEVLGLSPGMTLAKVGSTLAGRAEPGVTKSSVIVYGRQSKELPGSDFTARQTFAVRDSKLKPSEIKDKLDVVYSADHGREQAVAITREQWFYEGARPRVEDRIADYVERYGSPSFRGSRGGTEIMLVWSFGVDGKQRPTANKEVLRWCSYNSESTPMLNVSRGDRAIGSKLDLCGSTTLSVVLNPMLDTKLLLHAFTSFIDYSAVFASQDRALERIRSAEGHAAAEESRRAKEAKPSL